MKKNFTIISNAIKSFPLATLSKAHKHLKLCLVVLTALFTFNCAAQELTFQNVSLKSGTAGADNAVYLFPLVDSIHDALVTINGRSSSLVTLKDVDLTNTGFNKAFQPEIVYNNGNVSGSQTWWMEFTISFVAHNTNTAAILTEVDATALDIDGASNLYEWDAFYNAASYALDNNSMLAVSNLTVNSVTVGKKFSGPQITYAGIDTTQKGVMTMNTYYNTSSIKIRLGATTTASVSGADRLYSIWFKPFKFALSVLPVTMENFSATLNNNGKKVNVNWTTATASNISHFVVQRSTDGTTFTDAGLVFTEANSTSVDSYSLPDDISSLQSTLIYYRLCTIDLNGRMQYSNIIVIRISKQINNNITIISYPNPVTSELRVTIPYTWENKQVSYQLFNINGQLSKRIDKGNGSQTETINVSNIPAGMYIMKVTCDGQTTQQKIIKN